MAELRVLIDEEEVGSIIQERGGKLRFVYDEAWRGADGALPLSLSMPLSGAEHPHKAIEAYLWNLLPDREELLRQIAQEHGISPRNAFGLAGARGEDLQGAVQIVAAERIPHLHKRERVARISEAALCELLHNRLRAAGRTHIGEDSGFFSLAGSQAKLAACLMNGRWYEQRGYTPSTHIIKPTMTNLEDQVENEHFCLKLASALGLPAVKSEVRQIGDLRTIVVERYDRVRFDGARRLPLTETGGRVFRLHQEDMCSALSIHPAEKYQRHGGPGMKRIMRLLEGSGAPETDRERFMKACALNFVIAGVDAHGKNYSVLIERGGRYRLAPLYDVISALAYDARTYNKLAMTVGGEGKHLHIYPRNWEKAAAECRYNGDAAVRHVREIIEKAPDAASDVLAGLLEEGLQPALLTRLAAAISERCKALREVYDMGASV